MKTIRGISLVLLLCTVVLAQTTSQSAGQSKDTPDECATANRKTGYALDIDLPNAKTKTKSYNVDYNETNKDHLPICLSKKGGEQMLWLSLKGQDFKLKFHPKEPGRCGQHPFKNNPQQGVSDGYFSGPLRGDVPDGCEYDVEAQKDGEKPTDPHIKVVP
jgi:hypothetical protein